MPELAWNKSTWDAAYDWSQGGDEWSAAWGGTVLQWEFVWRPRFQRFLPAARILELAPGFGRWTQFLLPLAQQLTLVDYAQKCIDACRQRFAGATQLQAFVNDGLTLPMIPTGSIDFALSLDSLVHVDWSILNSYLTELSQKLSPDGVAVLHHSNLAELFPNPRDARATEPRWHHRAPDVSADKVLHRLTQLGMATISQELVNWGTVELIDSITIFTPRTSRFAQPTAIYRNHSFMEEAELTRRKAGLYGPLARPA